MQMKELQSMTVVQLRALARENKVKLSAGIDKEGIVQRLYHALGDSDESTAATQEEAAPVSAEGTVSAESSAVPQGKPAGGISGGRCDFRSARAAATAPGAANGRKKQTAVITRFSVRDGRRAPRPNGRLLPVPHGSSSSGP